MIHLQATNPSHYEQLFYKQLCLQPIKQTENFTILEHPNIGYIRSYGSLDTIKSGIGHYTIPSEFSMKYNYSCSYLHFGMIHQGVRYSMDKNKRKAKSTPSAFLSIDHPPTGEISYWKQGQHFKGIEICINMDYLYSYLCPILNISPSSFSFLQENSRYTCLSEQLISIILKFEHLLIHESITYPLQLALAMEFIAHLILPETSTHLFVEAFSPKKIQVGNRLLSFSKEDFKKIEHAYHFIEEQAHTFPTIYSISCEIGLSEQKLKAGFQYMYHQTIWNFANTVRMNKAIDLLKNTNYHINDISEIVGYQSPTAFHHSFKKWSGITPNKFRTLLQSENSSH